MVSAVQFDGLLGFFMLMNFGVFLEFLCLSLVYLPWISVLIRSVCLGSVHWSGLKSALGFCTHQDKYLPLVSMLVMSAAC